MKEEHNNTDMIDAFYGSILSVETLRQREIKEKYHINVDLAIHMPKQIILRTDLPKNDFWIKKYCELNK